MLKAAGYTDCMHAIILGGEKSRNRDWAKKMANRVEPIMGSASIFEYEHWSSKQDEPRMHINNEVARLAERAKALTDQGEQYALVAKSAGTWVALRAVKSAVVGPELAVLIGMPVLWSRRDGQNIDWWLKDYALPTLFIQQSEDPAMSAADVRDLLTERNVQNSRFAEVPGNDHHYRQVARIGQLIAGNMEGLLASEVATGSIITNPKYL
jgi:hypothetical protein